MLTNQGARSAAHRHERLRALFERIAEQVVAAGLSRVRIDNEQVTGDTISVGGRRLVNFGSCAYAGLNYDPRIKAAAMQAVERFGSVYSSSPAYTAVSLYASLEERLETVFEAPFVLAQTVTIGHIGALPALVEPNDAVLVDAHSHSSVHVAAQLLAGNGIQIVTVPHNNFDTLARLIGDLAPVRERVWYLADSIYSMHGDTAPLRRVASLQESHQNLWTYYDDAHGTGWEGKHGRGLVLETIGLHPRTVIAASLAKGVGSGGAAIVFPSQELANRVLLSGSTLTFSGPIHPAELGAAVAAADIMVSDELVSRRARLQEQFALLRELVAQYRLPVVATDDTPIWFLQVGEFALALELAKRMMESGFYTNMAAFPAVQWGQAGIRFTNTVYHSDAQIEDLIDAFAHHYRSVVSREEELVIDLTEGAAASG
jgi:7-keto-8-aminopelargonate synthetase-like enzyme